MKPSKAQKKEVLRLVADITPEDEREVRARFKWAEKQARIRGAAEDLLEGVKSLWEMLVDPDWVVSWETKAWIIAALTYFICPLDAIPDPLPGGYLDDAIVVMFVLHQLADEVAKYRKAKGSP